MYHVHQSKQFLCQKLENALHSRHYTGLLTWMRRRPTSYTRALLGMSSFGSTLTMPMKLSAASTHRSSTQRPSMQVVAISEKSVASTCTDLLQIRMASTACRARSVVIAVQHLQEHRWGPVTPSQSLRDSLSTHVSDQVLEHVTSDTIE